jgi:hypothetical protein
MFGQYYHGVTKLSAIWLAVRHLGDYSLAYPYDLSDSDDILDYNIEQQAAIIEDWWLITKGMCRSTTLVGTRVCHLTPLTSIRCGAWDRRQYRQYRDIGAFDRLRLYGTGAAPRCIKTICADRGAGSLGHDLSCRKYESTRIDVNQPQEMETIYVERNRRY